MGSHHAKNGEEKIQMVDYQKQATDFLEAHGLQFRAVNRYRDKCPGWAGDDKRTTNCYCGQIHGDHYRVTISGTGRKRLTFSFWNSPFALHTGENLTAYDVLSCVSGDIDCPETFEDFCDAHGFDCDSRKSLACFKQCAKFRERLRTFFTDEEREALQEIEKSSRRVRRSAFC